MVQREMEKPGSGDKVECTLEQTGSICRLRANPEGERQGGIVPPPFGLGPRVGARVVSPRSPILRPGHAHSKSLPWAGQWADRGRAIHFLKMPSLVKSVSDLRSVPTDGLGDIRRAGGPEEANRRIAQRGHDLGTAALADATGVLPERHVAHVMRPILDRPVASGPPEQGTGIGPLARALVMK